jgi:predicted nucleotidyltransferase
MNQKLFYQTCQRSLAGTGDAMRKILRIKFGSHLYGTDTPESDFDFKSIFIPSAREIILNKGKATYNTMRTKGDGEKNYAGEEDEESFSLQQFLKLLSEGQTVSLDVLFAPSWAHLQEPSPVWRDVVQNRDRLLTKKSSAFVGYARQQANKYGIKGSRVASSRLALDFLKNMMEIYGTQEKLKVVAPEIEMMIHLHDHMSMREHVNGHGAKEYLWEVCNRQMPLTASIKNAYDIMQRIVDEYGKRALQAEKQEGVDWKALSHAVRVSEQAVELLTTGNVTFPRQNAEYLKAIKKGELSYQEVAEQIETLLEEVERIAPTSVLPDEVDQEWIDNFVFEIYRKEILG